MDNETYNDTAKYKEKEASAEDRIYKKLTIPSKASVDYHLVSSTEQANKAEEIVYDALVANGFDESALEKMTFSEALENLALVSKVNARAKKRQRPDEEVGSVYLHIDNGGVYFSVLDTGSGPAVQVSASHFGHPTAQTKVMLDRYGLKALAELFTRAAVHEYKDAPYCCAAHLSSIDGEHVNRDGTPWVVTEGSCCSCETASSQKTKSAQTEG